MSRGSQLWKIKVLGSFREFGDMPVLQAYHQKDSLLYILTFQFLIWDKKITLDATNW